MARTATPEESIEIVRPTFVPPDCIVATMATAPDADGWTSLSVRAGGRIAEVRRAAADRERICLIETSDGLLAVAEIRPL